MDFNKIIDLFFFKEKEKDNTPVITTGAIIWGTLLRSFLFIIISFFVIRKYMLYDYIILFIFLLWFLVAMPAYKSYKDYNIDVDKFKDDTLCGSCRYFERSAQLCKILDQHPTRNHIPCEGLSWEPITYEDSQR